MMKYTVLVIALLFLINNRSIGQELSAAEVLSKSQSYHDPQGLLSTAEVHLFLNEPRKDGSARKTELTIDTPRELFNMNRRTDEHEIFMGTEAGKFTGKLDGSEDFSEEEAKKHKLNPERLNLMKNYYKYLWFLPIKLSDPGTIIADEVLVKDFFGKEGYEMKVTYDPTVGKDTWYFYFDQKTFALIGYRFYHDESKNDGEYILISEEVSDKGVKIPAIRKWYKHQKDEYLGEDILEKIEIVKH